MLEERRSLCRICTAQCPILVGVDEQGRPVTARGDKSNPSSEGFFCAKGKHFPEMHTYGARFLAPQRRNKAGEFERISPQTAITEVAARLSDIMQRHGPRSVAVYCGTLFYQLPSTAAFATAWMDAAGIKMRFSSGTIDQPGKQVAAAAHGHWLGGSFPFDECDTWMLVGTNPLVSISGGIPHANPGRRLKRALARGMDLIVIDPRRTESARQARLHLQPRPSTDPAVLAGIIREIFESDLVDREFLAGHAAGLDALRAAVEPFTPAVVNDIADVPSEQLREAAHLFAAPLDPARPGGRRRKGACTAGTGANMSGWSNINEYLVLCLNTICGKYRQAGDRVSNPGVLTVRRDYKGQAIPPYPIDGYGKPLRVRGFSPAVCGLPTSALADEILQPGDGQIRALITIGGNPLMAWPDQQKTLAALESLELNVVFEPRRTATTELADYVLPPKLPLETPGTSLSTENLSVVSPALGYTEQYGQYVPAIVEPPAGADLVEDWEYFYGIAKAMGLALTVRSGVFPIMGAPQPFTEVDMQTKPSSEAVLDMLCKNSWVPLQQLRDQPEQVLFSGIEATVLDADPDNSARLDLGNPEMLAELAEFASGKDYLRSAYPLQLISRRLPNTFNSVGMDISGLRERYPGNPLFMHPEDMQLSGLGNGEEVCLESAHGSVQAIIRADKSLRKGCVALTHCWGGMPQHSNDCRTDGSAISRLISVEEDFARYSGIPLMSGIPVRVTTASGEPA